MIARSVDQGTCPQVFGGEAPGSTVLYRLALSLYTERIFGSDETETYRAFDEHLEELFQSLLDPGPTQLEALLAERVVVCHAALYEQETRFGKEAKTLPPKQREAWEKSINRLQARYLSAIKSLAQVRRLRLPDVQINIGQHQTNIA